TTSTDACGPAGSCAATSRRSRRSRTSSRPSTADGRWSERSKRCTGRGTSKASRYVPITEWSRIRVSSLSRASWAMTDDDRRIAQEAVERAHNAFKEMLDASDDQISSFYRAFADRLADD